MLDLTGRWSRERSPQRRPFAQGPGSAAGPARAHRARRDPGDGGGHALLRLPDRRASGACTWPGAATTCTYAERTPEGESLLGAHELLGPGELVLAPGEAYTTPWLLGSWSGEGLDPMSHRLHALGAPAAPGAARRPARSCSTPGRRRTSTTTSTGSAGWPTPVRPWASSGSCSTTAGSRAAGTTTPASATGPSTRRSGRRGCTRWSTTSAGSGMEFGLWVEPEMVNLDSDLVREHPDWVLRGRSALPAGVAPPAGARPAEARRVQPHPGRAGAPSCTSTTSAT